MTIDSLDGKRIAITGAGRGLGRALAIVAADQGASVVLLGRDPGALQDTANVIHARCRRNSLVVPLDLADPDSIAAACTSVLESDQTLDILINNGAPWLPGSIDEITDAEITTTIAAAVTGTILVTKGLLPGLRRSEAADIVTVVSTAGILGWRDNGASVPFYAAKHGQSGFADRLRRELKNENIRVTSIYPPDFDDVDPTHDDWAIARDTTKKMSNRDVVSTIFFALTADRCCSFPVIVMENSRSTSA